MKNFKSIIKFLGLAVFVVAAGLSSVSKTFADDILTTGDRSAQIQMLSKLMSGKDAAVDALPEPQFLPVKKEFDYLNGAVKSYDGSSIVNVQNSKLTNDLILGSEFEGNDDYKIRICTGFTGGELTEVDEATGREPRESLLGNLQSLRTEFVNEQNQVVLKKDAERKFTPGKQLSDGNMVKDDLSFYVKVNRNEIPFGQKYRVKVYNAETNQLVGYSNDYCEIPAQNKESVDLEVAKKMVEHVKEAQQKS